MEVHLDGRQITTEAGFHRELSCKLDLGPYYGQNLHALWDRLSRDVERPLRIIWHDSSLSRSHLGPAFVRIVSVLDQAAREDAALGLEQRFEYVLE